MAPSLAHPLADELEQVFVLWRTSAMSPQTIAKFVDLAGRFSRYSAHAGCITLAEIDGDVTTAWVTAPGRNGAPAVATMHMRRTVVRALFGSARQLGLTPAFDPTLDLALPAKSGASWRPLTDEEMALVELWAAGAVRSTREPAVVALAEATARTGELASIRVCDLDLSAGRVWIAGSRRNTLARWGALTDWGVAQLRRRLDALGDRADDHWPVAYDGRSGEVSAQAAACGALARVMRRAGLADEPDLRPHSIAAWGVRRIFDTTGRVEEAARAAGLRSLDTTAAFISFEWSEDQP